MPVDPISSPPRAGEFPPVFGYNHLSLLLGRTVATLQADRCRNPDSVPPACTPPGTKSPRWLLSVVLDWLAQYQQQPKTPKAPRVGRPTKAEEVARRQGREGGAA